MIITIDTKRLDDFSFNPEDVPILLETFDALSRKIMFTTKAIYTKVEEVINDSPIWVKEILSNVNKSCYINNNSKEIFKFKGIEETYEDYYYILENNNEIRYETAVSKIQFL